MNNFRKYFSEFLGTACLVSMSCGTAMSIGFKSSSHPENVLLIAISLGFGFISMYYCFSSVSAAHFNPALSVATMLNKRMSFKDCFFYIVSQLLGASAGIAVLALVWRMGNLEDLTNSFAALDVEKLGIPTTFIIEIIATFVFVLAVLSVSSKKEQNCFNGVASGLSFTLVNIFGIFLIGICANPAINFASLLVLTFWGNPNALSTIWVPFLSTLAGSILAAYAHKFTVKS